MATDTPNFNWPIPEDTDLVKDGAKAIRDLGNAIDTSAQDFGGGLVHIETQNWTGVSAVNFDNVFSATFDSYLICVNSLQPVTNATNISLRYRVAGSDDTANEYLYGRYTVGAVGSVAAASENGTRNTLQILGQMVSTRVQGLNFTLYNPFLSVTTAVTSHFAGRTLDLFSGVNEPLTSYDGFSLLCSSGNFTGRASVYGYRK
jgi:hypothetical protein